MIWWRKKEDKSEKDKKNQDLKSLDASEKDVESIDIVEDDTEKGENLDGVENNIYSIESPDILESGNESIKSKESENLEEVVEYDVEEIVEGNVSDNDEQIDNSKETVEASGGFFARLLDGISKTKKNITDRIDSLLGAYKKIDEELIEDLEEILITADVGVNTTLEIIDRLREKIKKENTDDISRLKEFLKDIVEEILSEGNTSLVTTSPTVIVMVGVNGVGKTTTIGKIAQRLKNENKRVMLAAGDTFRAAATEQLDIWANRAGVEIVKHQEGADPGAVVFDAIKASKSRGVDVLIVDTAGRLHNKQNLMKELGKIFKIIDREFPEANKEVLLVVDATTGQNAVSQAKTFKEVANITGIVLTKLDGTAKGGVVIAVKSEVGVPVKLIGVGEKVEDLQDFDPKSFTKALFE